MRALETRRTLTAKRIRIESPINRTVIKVMKIQKKVRQLKPRRKILIRWGSASGRGEDINSSLERTELKSRLEEAGYEAAMYFAGDDSDTQAEQIRSFFRMRN